ncbi:SHOCT domain-containing protein [Natrialbaceae archaeon A-CW1-1]
MFELESDPGEHDQFKPCPKCEEDKIYRTRDRLFNFSNGRLFTPFDYYCDNCGYEASKDEITKSFSQLVEEANSSNEINLDMINDAELRQEVEDRQAEGWEIKEIDQENHRVVMENSKGGTIGGHALTGLVTGFWTFGAGNVAYEKLSKKKNKERIALSSNVALVEDDGELEQLVDISEKLRNLKSLNEEGVITDDEFKNKKEELLEKI